MEAGTGGGGLGDPLQAVAELTGACLRAGGAEDNAEDTWATEATEILIEVRFGGLIMRNFDRNANDIMKVMNSGLSLNNISVPLSNGPSQA